MIVIAFFTLLLLPLGIFSCLLKSRYSSDELTDMGIHLGKIHS